MREGVGFVLSVALIGTVVVLILVAGSVALFLRMRRHSLGDDDSPDA